MAKEKMCKYYPSCATIETINALFLDASARGGHQSAAKSLDSSTYLMTSFCSTEKKTQCPTYKFFERLEAALYNKYPQPRKSP